jgi:hypothetical protein
MDLFSNNQSNQQNGPSEFAIDQNNKSSSAPKHPSLNLCRKETNDIQRQNINVRCEYSESIDFYLRELEECYNTRDSLKCHKITPALRARMVDWMIEVLTNFKSDD